MTGDVLLTVFYLLYYIVHVMTQNTEPRKSMVCGALGMHAKCAMYRLLHILHINMRISAYFHGIFFAYSTNTVYICIQVFRG